MPVKVKFGLGFWGGQPFSCPCSQKCNAQPKKDLLDMFVSAIHSRSLVLERQSTDEEIRESVTVKYSVWSHNPARTSSDSK